MGIISPFFVFSTLILRNNVEAFRKDLENIARTTLSSKVLSQDKGHFAKLVVDAVLRLKGSTNLDSIQVIKKVGGRLVDSYLDDGNPPSPYPISIPNVRFYSRQENRS
jgi:chaperonin GroEL (HSP60 family)